MITNCLNFKKLLADKGIKPTYPRLKVLEYLSAGKNHPTADMIYKDIVKAIPTMSKTTVYNTVKSFVEKGIVLPIVITGTETRYDIVSCCHHHFLCEKCGKIIDLQIDCPNVHKKELDGHIIKEIHGYFKGICKDCKQK